MIDYHLELLRAKALKENETLAAYYQPIIAMDTRRIMGYEVLGRAVDSGHARSLGPFFCDSSVSVEEHILLDRLIRRQALSKLSTAVDPPMLFINLKPSWIVRSEQMGEKYTFILLDKYEIDPRRIVVEVTEEAFNGCMDDLRSVIDRYRERGCLIAIDDVGSGFSNMERIAQLQPNLMKIDMHLIKKSATHDGYFSVLRSLSELADQIGASMLVEGVETREDLARSIQVGARYVQGFLFAKAGPDFLPEDSFSALIESELDWNIERMIGQERYWQNQADELAGNLAQYRISDPGEKLSFDEADAWIERLLPQLGEQCIRIYICNEKGIQLCSNYVRESDRHWRKEEQYRGVNWSWRPYFVPNYVQLNEEGKHAIVSRPYTDLDTHMWIRTVSALISPECILFADIQDRERQLERL